MAYLIEKLKPFTERLKERRRNAAAILHSAKLRQIGCQNANINAREAWKSVAKLPKCINNYDH